MIAVLALVLGVQAPGCAPKDPNRQAAIVYMQQLEPLLLENSVLSDAMLTAAADRYNQKATSTDLRRVWDLQIVPLAVHLHDQAGLVQPPDPWIDDHERLVGVWATRAEAYQSLAQALDDGDQEAWDAARAVATQAKLDEEEWFRAVNAELAPMGLLIDQFP